MKRWMMLGAFAAVAMQTQANGYWLRERLDGVPESARLEGGGATQTIRGRNAGVNALQLTGGALAWDVQTDRDGFIEFWLKPVKWDALAEAEVPVGRFRIGETEYRLFKAAGQAELRLAAGDPVTAVTLADESADLARSAGACVDVALAEELAGRALAADGRVDEGVELLQRAASAFDACGTLRWRDRAERELDN